MHRYKTEGLFNWKRNRLSNLILHNTDAAYSYVLKNYVCLERDIS